MAFCEGQVDVHPQFAERHGGRSLQTRTVLPAWFVEVGQTVMVLNEDGKRLTYGSRLSVFTAAGGVSSTDSMQIALWAL